MTGISFFFNTCQFRKTILSSSKFNFQSEARLFYISPRFGQYIGRLALKSRVILARYEK